MMTTMATTMMASRSVADIEEANLLVDGMQTTMHGHATEGRISLRPLLAEGMTLDLIHQASLRSSIFSVSRSRRMPRTFYLMLFEIAHRPGVLETDMEVVEVDLTILMILLVVLAVEMVTTTSAVLLDFYPDFLVMVELAVEVTTETTLEVETILENLIVPGA
eukprot:1684276-Amphidinium_carterae.1